MKKFIGRQSIKWTMLKKIRQLFQAAGSLGILVVLFYFEVSIDDLIQRWIVVSIAYCALLTIFISFVISDNYSYHSTTIKITGFV